MKRRDVLGVLVAGPYLQFLSSCSPSSFANFNFRLSVEMDTPEGPLLASGVYNMRAGSSIPGSKRSLTRVRGEAVAIDLPDGQTLFVLIKYESGGHIGNMAMSKLAPDIRFPPEAARYLQEKGASLPVELPRTQSKLRVGDGKRRKEQVSGYPLMVIFGDVGDPASVERVYPDDPIPTLGPGYAIRRMTVQLTNDPISTGLEDRLKQFGVVKDRGLDRTPGGSANLSLSQRLGYSDFIRSL